MCISAQRFGVFSTLPNLDGDISSDSDEHAQTIIMITFMRAKLKPLSLHPGRYFDHRERWMAIEHIWIYLQFHRFRSILTRWAIISYRYMWTKRAVTAPFSHVSLIRYCEESIILPWMYCGQTRDQPIYTQFINYLHEFIRCNFWLKLLIRVRQINIFNIQYSYQC